MFLENALAELSKLFQRNSYFVVVFVCRDCESKSEKIEKVACKHRNESLGK